MTDRKNDIPTDRVRSGRRFAVDIDMPRDKTVCFTVSEDERIAIDVLAACMGRTRSSVLTRIVNAFVADSVHEGQPEELTNLLSEFRVRTVRKPNRK